MSNNINKDLESMKYIQSKIQVLKFQKESKVQDYQIFKPYPNVFDTTWATTNPKNLSTSNY